MISWLNQMIEKSDIWLWKWFHFCNIYTISPSKLLMVILLLTQMQLHNLIVLQQCVCMSDVSMVWLSPMESWWLKAGILEQHVSLNHESLSDQENIFFPPHQTISYLMLNRSFLVIPILVFWMLLAKAASQQQLGMAGTGGGSCC